MGKKRNRKQQFAPLNTEADEMDLSCEPALESLSPTDFPCLSEAHKSDSPAKKRNKVGSKWSLRIRLKCLKPFRHLA